MSKPKEPKYKGHANPELAAAMRELRRSNAAGTHDSRPNRERARGQAKRADIRRGLDS